MNNLSGYFIFFHESVTLFMAIFFFIQFSILKKKEYLFYALYLLLLPIYYLLAIPEFFFGVVHNDKDAIASFDLFKRPIQFLISVFYTLFVMYYLRLKKKSIPLYLIFRALLLLYFVLSLGCLICNFLGVGYDTVYYIFGLLLFPVQLYVVVALFKYKVPYSRYIIWGSIIVIVGSIITLTLSMYAAINPGGYIDNSNSYIPVMLSIMADIFLFTVALQRKIADNETSLINAAFSRQQAVMLERERIIADLHDDVGGGLSSIRMMSDLMAQQAPQNKGGNAPNFSVKISATAKEIAQRMNTIIWSLNTENDTLQNFGEYVRQFGISYFENSPVKFIYSIDADVKLNTELSGVQRKNLFLIIKEALHNILKHSGASGANIYIMMENKMLCIKIADNGKGIQNPGSFGNGLKNMKKRMDEIKGTINFNSDNGTLIKITVSLT